MEELDQAAVVFQFVLTKADKTSEGSLQETVEKITRMMAKHPAAYPEILITSSRDNTGFDRLRASLAALAAPHQFG